MSTPRRKATDAARWKRRVASETPEQRAARLLKRRNYMLGRGEEARQKQREWRNANPDKAKAYSASSRAKFTEEMRRQRRIYRARQNAEKRAFVRALKLDKPCADCKNVFPPYCMDFDHRDPAQKRWEVSWAVYKTISIEEIKREAEKCDLICSNCHRIRSYKKLHPTTI